MSFSIPPISKPQMFKGNALDWDTVENVLLLMADEDLERADELADRLAVRVKQLQREADIELVCAELFN